MSYQPPPSHIEVHTELSDLGLIALTAYIPPGDYSPLVWETTLARLRDELDAVEAEMRRTLALLTDGDGELVAGVDAVHIGAWGPCLARSLRIKPKQFSELIVSHLFES